MSDSAREFGYVIRHVRTNDSVTYESEFSDSFGLDRAKVYSLSELNKRVCQTHFCGIIVRVRRVASETWERAANEEAAEFMYGYGETESTLFPFEQANSDRTMRFAALFKRAPGTPRWEVVDE